MYYVLHMGYDPPLPVGRRNKLSVCSCCWASVVVSGGKTQTHKMWNIWGDLPSAKTHSHWGFWGKSKYMVNHPFILQLSVEGIINIKQLTNSRARNSSVACAPQESGDAWRAGVLSQGPQRDTEQYRRRGWPGDWRRCTRDRHWKPRRWEQRFDRAK